MDTTVTRSGEEHIATFARLLRNLEPPPQPLLVEPLADRTDIHRFRFISSDQCDQIVSVIAKLNYASSQLSRGSSEDYRTSKDVVLERLQGDVYQAFCAYAMPLLTQVTQTVWDWQCNRITDAAIIEYGPGAYYKEHVDAAESQLHSIRHLSFLVHLSDDFAGGETCFRRQAVCVTPMKGCGIVFPAGITHPHESITVKAGVKYVIVGWLTRI